MSHEKAKPDIHQEVTDNIIKILDQVDLKEYEPPFARLAAMGLPENPTTQNHYQGVNILALWFNQQSKKYTSNKWATFKQWKEKGVTVKKGEKGSRVIFYKTLIKSEENDQGEKEDHKIPMLRLYNVFNANQVEGFEDEQSKIPESDQVERIALIDEFCAQTKADIRYCENEAYYNIQEDFINMPDTNQFFESKNISATQHYYSTLLHELTHWTGAPKRLARLNASGSEKREDYAFEELIAELGAAFLCAKHEIKQTQPTNHALYIKSWLKNLNEDKTYIFKAAAQAAKATEFLNSFQEPTP